MLFDKVIAFDSLRQKIILIVNILLNETETEYNKAVIELQQLCGLLKKGKGKNESGGHLPGEVTPLFDKATYSAMAEKAKQKMR